MLDEKLAEMLVVDEDERTRPAARSWMRSQGYDGHCLPDGRSALRFLQAYRPKFAVIDMTTADDGLDVLHAIRRDPRLRDLPMVVHVAVPDAAGGYHAQAYLTRGIDWQAMHAEGEKYAQ